MGGASWGQAGVNGVGHAILRSQPCMRFHLRDYVASQPAILRNGTAGMKMLLRIIRTFIKISTYDAVVKVDQFN